MRARDLQVRTGAEWLDIGYGECQLCHVERRLYRPVDRLDVHVCASCSQVAVTSSIPHDYGEGAAEDSESRAAETVERQVDWWETL